jgi:WD40 repeat protein
MHLVTVTKDKTAQIWETSTGKLTTAFSGHEGVVQSVQFSPNGALVVTTSDDQPARVWEVSTGKLVARLAGRERADLDARFSPDGTHIVTASADETAHAGWVAQDRDRLAGGRL